LQDGDIISIDAEKGTLDVELDAAELAARAKRWKAPPNAYQSGALRKYADQVGPARNGAVTHAGAKGEVVCYADI
jgi:dihydroxy-acid dehydratase